MCVGCGECVWSVGGVCEGSVCGECEGGESGHQYNTDSLLQWRWLTCPHFPCHLPSESLLLSCSLPSPPHVVLQQLASVSVPPRHLPTALQAGHIARAPSGGQTVPLPAPPPSPHTWPHRWSSCLSVSAALEGHGGSVTLLEVTPASHVPLRELAPGRKGRKKRGRERQFFFKATGVC